jgi:hypothetical protein
MHTRCKPEAWCIVSLHSEGRHGAPVASLLFIIIIIILLTKLFHLGRRQTDFYSTQQRGEWCERILAVWMSRSGFWWLGLRMIPGLTRLGASGPFATSAHTCPLLPVHTHQRVPALVAFSKVERMSKRTSVFFTSFLALAT